MLAGRLSLSSFLDAYPSLEEGRDFLSRGKARHNFSSFTSQAVGLSGQSNGALAIASCILSPGSAEPSTLQLRVDTSILEVASGERYPFLKAQLFSRCALFAALALGETEPLKVSQQGSFPRFSALRSVQPRGFPQGWPPCPGWFHHAFLYKAGYTRPGSMRTLPGLVSKPC